MLGEAAGREISEEEGDMRLTSSSTLLAGWFSFWFFCGFLGLVLGFWVFLRLIATV